MKWRWTLVLSAFALATWATSSQGQWFKGVWTNRSPSDADAQEIPLVRAVLEREFEGHARRNLEQILSCYADNCVGYYADGAYDPRKWSVGIAGIKELRSSKEDLLIQMRENLEIFVTHFRGDEVQHIDVKRNFAAAASRHHGAATNRETGEEVRWDWINFWTLAKIGGQWKITGFISQVVSE